MPTIRLVTDDDMRAITSQTLELLDDLPHLYIPAGAVDIELPPAALEMPADGLMRSWGVAHERSLRDFVRIFPDALVAPRSQGQFIARAELLFCGAEPAADFA